ncbi:MAG: class I SAM-dependent methyltransferase [Melioribacteraceae bacterium]|nr:class I SAM-dependent methyltransferase [Melioribacteraceae bacterium]
MALVTKSIKSINIDIENENIILNNDKENTITFNSPEAFNLISNLWLRLGWDTKYVYSFTWLGRPIIQLPEDLIRIQEVIFQVKPDVIIETGIAHGGGLIFYASLCRAMGKGKVVGVDVDIRLHNRKAIEEHEMFKYISIFEGDSIDSEIVKKVGDTIKPNDTVIVFLDSNHTKEHVLNELLAYSKFVTKDSYIVAMDGIMKDIVGAPRTKPDWSWNNPQEAIFEFVKQNSNFEVEEPAFPFNEGAINKRVTYWPNAFIKRIK